MLPIKSHWLGVPEANERAESRLAKQARDLTGLSASTGMSPDDFAMVTFGAMMGANVNEAVAIDLSTYNAVCRMRFAKEFSRLFDAEHGTQGPTPNFNMSCLFWALDEPFEDGYAQPRDILTSTVRKTYESFLGTTAIVCDTESKSHNGVITAIGGTKKFVDRREYYSQFYDEEHMRLDQSGMFMVREHTVLLGELAIDLDSVVTIETV